MEKKLNIKYAFTQGLYWMIYCVFLGYASVYLLDKTYTNTQIGFIMATGFLCSILLQQIVAAYTDRSNKVTVLTVTLFCIAFLLLFSIVLLAVSRKSPLLTFAFICISIVIMLLQPLINSINFYLVHRGITMNFGVARSFGSLFYAIISALLGIALVTKSTDFIPKTGMILLALFFVLLLSLFFDDKKLVSLSKEKEADTSLQEHFSIKDFCYQYRFFFLFLLGGLGMFFGHTTINNYCYQICLHVGGNSADLGNIQAFSAILELPAMIFFSQLNKRFGCRKLLQIAAFFFSVKILITLFAGSVLFLYISMIFQMFAFAVYIPGSVHFVDEIMSSKDAVKGQAFVTGMITLANLLASILGGFLIDNFGISVMLTVGTIATLFGTIVSISVLHYTKNNCL